MAIKLQSLPYDPLRITSPYGPRNTGIAGASAYHRGVDMGADKSRYKGNADGGPVRSVLPGMVAASYRDKARGWVVLIDHGTIEGRNIKTLYQHLMERGAASGTAVRAGDMIGTMGNTGVGAQLHLHFEVRVNNVCVDPGPYLDKIEEVKDLTEAEVRAVVKEMLEGGGDTPSPWAKKEWENAKRKGVTDGTRPQGHCTREQVVVMMARKG